MGKDIKKILVPNKAPTGTSFKTDQIVINPIDGKAYIKTTDNTVIELGSGAGSIDTGSLLRSASVVGSTITFIQGDGSTFDATIGGTGGFDITASNQSSVLTRTARSFNFQGNAVTTTNSGNDINVTISTGSTPTTSFTLAGDSGTQTISDGDTLDIEGGTNITTAAGSTDKVTVNLDSRITLTDITASSDISASGTIVANKIESDQLVSHVGDDNTGLQFAADTVIIEANDDIIGRFASNRITLGNFESGFTGTQISGSIKITGSTTTSERTPLVVDSDGNVSISEIDIDKLNNPTDTSLSDGLFPFTTNTTYTDAIDDINELLSSLAPSPAPSLSDIRNTTSVDNTSGETDGDVTTAELSFGTTNSGVITNNDYTNVTGLTGLTPAGNLGAVNTDGTFGATISTDQRIGVFDLNTDITGKLNETQVQNPSDTGTNHGPDAFKQAHLGSLKLYVNDNTTAIHTLDLTSDMGAIASNVNTNGSGFTNISATQSANFPNGDPFTSFIHRSGSIVVDKLDQRNGWNFARVVHSSSVDNFEHTTNYLEWVNDSSGSSSDNAVSFSDRTLKQNTPSGTRYISQIPYFTGVNIELTASFDNAYIMTYVASNAISFQDENSNLGGFSSQNLPTLGNSNPKTAALTASSDGDFNSDVTNGYFFTSSESSNQTDGAGTDFGNGIGVRMKVSKPLVATANDSYSRTGSMLLISKNTTNNDIGSTADYKFLNEHGRLLSASYDNQSDVTDSGNAWDSQNTSIDTHKGLIVYGQPTDHSSVTQKNFNRVISPFSDTYSYKSGDFSGLYSAATPPNLSTMSHTELMFFLRYDNGSSALATKEVTIKGVNTTLVTSGTSLSGNNIHCFFKVPGTTGFRDMATSAPGNTTSVALNDGVGCYNGTVGDISLGSTNDSITIPVQLVNQSVPANGYAILKIVTHKDWEGYIYNILIS